MSIVTMTEIYEKARVRDWYPVDYDNLVVDIGDKKPKFVIDVPYLVRYIVENFLIRYDNDLMAWRAYVDNMWQPTNDIQIEALVNAHLPEIYRTSATRVQVKQNLLLNLSNDLFTDTPYLLNFMNGVLDIESRDFYPHDEHDTYKFFIINKLSSQYDPWYKSIIFDGFINQICEQFEEDEENVKKILQMFFGSILSPNCLHRCCLWMMGYTGHNGKSVMIDVMEGIFGSYYYAANFSEFDNRFGFTGLKGKKVMAVPEMPDASIRDNSRFKAVISGDQINIEHKGAGFETIRPQASLIICSNTLPKMSVVETAMFDRIRLIRLDRSFRDNPDRFLVQKIINEAPGVINWMLDGYDMLKGNRYEIGETAQMSSVKKAWFGRLDSVWEYIDSKHWVNPEIVAIEDVNGETKAVIDITNMYKDYKAFCESGEIQRTPKRINFIDSLQRILKSKAPVKLARKQVIMDVERFLEDNDVMVDGKIIYHVNKNPLYREENANIM